MSEYERRNFIHLIIPPSWRKDIQSRGMSEETQWYENKNNAIAEWNRKNEVEQNEEH